MEAKGYISSLINNDHTQCALVQINCAKEGTAQSLEFRKLADDICKLVLQFKPKYLDRSNIPEEVKENLFKECRRESLRRGIPDDDITKYASSLLEQDIQKTCLHELDLNGISVSGALKEFSQSNGNINVQRFCFWSIESNT